MTAEIVLSLGDTTDAEIIVETGDIITCMSDNSYFKDPEIVAQVGVVKAALAKLITALNAIESPTKGDDIVTARDELDRSLKKLAHKVEDIANDVKVLDINREAIIHSAGMFTKAKTKRGPYQFSVYNADASGSVVIRAKGGAVSYEWRRTYDVTGFTGWEHLPATTRASTIDFGLTKDVKVAYTYRPVFPNKVMNWEGPIIIMVR